MAVRDSVRLAPVGGESLSHHSNFVIRQVETQGVRLSLTSVYLICSIGMAKANLNMLQELARRLHILRVPCIIAGDFNATPEEIAVTGWLEAIDSSRWGPSTTFTCTAGQHG